MINSHMLTSVYQIFVQHAHTSHICNTRTKLFKNMNNIKEYHNKLVTEINVVNSYGK